MSKSPILLSLTLLLFSTQALAGGTIELNHDCALAGCVPGDAPGYPITLSEAGHYRLSSDLIVPASATAIHFDATGSRFQLDLRGFAIRGPFLCHGTPVSTCSGPGSAQDGIHIVNASGGHLRNGTVTGFAGLGARVNVNGHFQIDDVEFSNNAEGGVSLDTLVHSSQVRSARFLRNGDFGLSVSFTSTLASVIEGSLFYGNKGIGAVTTFGSITRSTFQSNGSLGAVGDGVGGCVLNQNLFRGNNSGAAQFAGCAHVNNVCGTEAC